MQLSLIPLPTWTVSHPVQPHFACRSRRLFGTVSVRAYLGRDANHLTDVEPATACPGTARPPPLVGVVSDSQRQDVVDRLEAELRRVPIETWIPVRDEVTDMSVLVADLSTRLDQRVAWTVERRSRMIMVRVQA